LIPGYLFGKLTDSEYIEVKEHKDVSKFLTEQGQSVTFPDEEVELLRKFQEKGIEYSVEDMIIGKDYVVESGEFKGLKGVLKNDRLYVRLRGIGLGISIKIRNIST
jgi:transcription antitermination factor NusG